MREGNISIWRTKQAGSGRPCSKILKQSTQLYKSSMRHLYTHGGPISGLTL